MYHKPPNTAGQLGQWTVGREGLVALVQGHRGEHGRYIAGHPRGTT